MGQNSGVDWCDHSWGCWRGCQPAPQREGCLNCYGARDMKRYGQDPHTVVRAAKATFNAPLKWPVGRVFVCPWSDFWHEAADDWRDDAYAIMRQRPDYTWIIPTKRENRIAACLPPDWGDGWANVILLTSVSTQQEADAAIPILLGVPGTKCKRGVSAEPLLEHLNLVRYFPGLESWEEGHPDSPHPTRPGGYSRQIPGISWVIAGCESGPNRRQVSQTAFVDLMRQCRHNGVPFFLKQWESYGQLIKMPELAGQTWAQYPARQAGLPML